MDNAPNALYLEIQKDLRPYLDPSLSLGNSLSMPTFQAKARAAYNLQEGLLKKLEVTNLSADKSAKDLFRHFNDRCSDWKSPIVRDDVSEQDISLYNTFAMLVEDFFLRECGDDAELSNSNVLDNAHVGPGAAIRARGTSFYAKFASSPLTATSNFLIDLYEADVCFRPYAVFTESFRRTKYGPPEVVMGSRISTVPKNVDISRIICVEPSINQFFQLGIGTILETRLRRVLGIDLKTQPDVNRRMAFSGSMQSEDDSALCTLDLKSASDSLSLGLVCEVLPPEVFSFLVRFRSHYTDIDGESVRLNMFSTMGNGFTFPIQTILFSCAVLAAREHAWGSSSQSIPSKQKHANHYRPRLAHANEWEWSVFGDDIVCQRREYTSLVRLLSLMGCVVNEAKSFDSGPFRESCGRDFYHGYNVRPVYIRKLKTPADITVALNLLNKWSVRTGVSLEHSIRYLLNLYSMRSRARSINPVPLSENDDAGFRVPYSVYTSALRRCGIKTPRDGNKSMVYQRKVGRPPRYTILERGVVKVPKGSKSIEYNPDGLLQSVLLGEIRGARIIAKSNSSLPYSTVKCVTPNWDFTLPNGVEGLPFVVDGDPQSWWVVLEELLYVHLVSSGWALRVFVDQRLTFMGLPRNRKNIRGAIRAFWTELNAD